jgi:amino acid adenylation domain-containing protein
MGEVTAHVNSSQGGSTAITRDNEPDPTAVQTPRPQLVHELFAAQARRRPKALAVSAPDATLTYAELAHDSDQLAQRLRALGVTRETTVGLCLERSARLVVGALGILKAEGAYVALDPSNPQERLQYMLHDSEARAVVTTARLAAKLRAAGWTAVIALDADSTAAEKDSDGTSASGNGAHDLAYVIYTSGSTGQPKGVLIEHASLLNLVYWHRRAFALTEEDRGTQFASPGFDAVVWELWPLLTSGGSVHVPPEELRTDPASLRDWLVEQRITIGFLPTSLAETVMALEWPAATSLRHLLTGGDALRRYPRARLPFTVVNNYGPAEAAVVATSGVVPAVADGAAEGTAAPSIGTPIDSVTVHVVDHSLRPVPAGEVGELLIGGAGVARGYLNRPELTAEKFVPDRFASETGRLYRTGDLVRVRADGQLEFVGRADEQVQIAGRRVELGEIAATLDRHPAVRRSVVIVAEERSGQKRLVACAVPSDAAHPDVETLRSSLATTLPDYMIPADIVWLTGLPMTVSDKVDRAALEQLIGTSILTGARSRSAPRNELEEALVAIVAELLGLDAVGIDENFFLLGGHSLLGAQMIARIEEQFGVELPLRDLFEKPTVAEMAREVERLLVAELEAMSDEEAERLMRVSQGQEGGH